MGGLFNTKTPKLPPPTRMPSQDDPEIRAARRRRIDEMRRRGGRRSTILTDEIASQGKLGA